MRKRLLVAGAAGLSVLGLTAAGASTLDLAGPGSWGQGIAQQSDVDSVSCVVGALEVAFPIEGSTVSTARLQQQNVQGCAGQEVQVVLYDADGRVAETVVERIVANGLDVVLDFAGPVDVQSFTGYRVTIGSEIVSS